MNNKEIWKDIVDYEGLYQVSNLGNIKNLLTDTLMKQYNIDDYLIVPLKKGTKTRIAKVDRLVAQAFFPNWNLHLYINHKDANRNNNNVSNLQIMTIQEKNSKTIKGEDTKKRCIHQIHPKTFEIVATYESFMAAARGVKNYSQSAGNNIQKVCTGERIGQKAYGYFWDSVD